MTDNARVLLVDGDEQVRVLLSKALLARDVVCISSPSAGDALTLLAVRSYALVLLQIEMPDAESVLGFIRSLPTAGQPVVMVTAEVRSPKDTIDTQLVQIIIRRPLRIDEVAGLIRACLEYLPAIDSANYRIV
jgi:DNA-binding response OmpR family regulator